MSYLLFQCCWCLIIFYIFLVSNKFVIWLLSQVYCKQIISSISFSFLFFFFFGFHNALLLYSFNLWLAFCGPMRHVLFKLTDNWTDGWTIMHFLEWSCCVFLRKALYQLLWQKKKERKIKFFKRLATYRNVQYNNNLNVFS